MAQQKVEIVAVDKTAAGTRSVKRNLKSIEGSLLSVNKLAGVAVAALGAIGGAKLIGGIVSTTARFQDLRTALKTVTGSAQDGARAFDFITNFATKTQFGVETLTETFITLKAAGIEPTEQLLTTFTDTAAVTTDQLGSLQAITALFSRTTAGGLGLEELNRLADRGVPVFAILEEQLGLTRLEISDFGKTAEGARKILDALTKGLNDSFGGATADRARNLSTSLSNLQIEFKKVADEIGKAGLVQALSDFVTEVTKAIGTTLPLAKILGEELGFRVFQLTNFLKNANVDFAKFAVVAKTVAGVVGGLVLGAALKKTAGLVKALGLAFRATPFGFVISSIFALVGALSVNNGLGRTIFQVRALLGKFGEMLSKVGSFISGVFIGVLDKLTDAFDFVTDGLIGLINSATEYVGFGPVIESTSKEIRDAVKTEVVEAFDAGTESVKQLVGEMGEFIEETVSTNEIIQDAAAVFNELKQAFIDAGLEYDEADERARELFKSTYNLNQITVDVTGNITTQAKVTADLNTTTAKLTEEQKKLRDAFVSTSFIAFQKQLTDLNKAYEAALEAQKNFLDDSVEIDNQFYTNKELLEQQFQQKRFEIIKEFEERIHAIQMRNIREALGENERATTRALTTKEKEFLARRGFEERNAQIINDRIEFEKKSELEKTQFGIAQGKKFFEALGEQNKGFFQAMKAFAIAEAIINTYQGATKALATYPPPFNFIAAAATVASGLAQVATIRAQQPVGAQRGGALRAGQSAIVGEDGPELLVPKQPSTVIPREVAEAIDGMGGRSQPVTVNFNINTVDARDFDDLLVERRATITGIINNAMRQQGRMGVV